MYRSILWAPQGADLSSLHRDLGLNLLGLIAPRPLQLHLALRVLGFDGLLIKRHYVRETYMAIVGKITHPMASALTWGQNVARRWWTNSQSSGALRGKYHFQFLMLYVHL